MRVEGSGGGTERRVLIGSVDAVADEEQGP
jgi:hypothetical protein